MGKKNKKAPLSSGHRIIARNKRARFDYHIENRYEAGIVLKGSEVKSIRAGHVSIGEAYGKFINGELFLIDAHISEYPWSHQFNHAPRRPRKLLMHKRELSRLADKVVMGGYALIPLSLYLKNGRVKVEMGLGKGKKKYDKRETMKKRSAQREMARRSDY